MLRAVATIQRVGRRAVASWAPSNSLPCVGANTLTKYGGTFTARCSELVRHQQPVRSFSGVGMQRAMVLEQTSTTAPADEVKEWLAVRFTHKPKMYA